MEGVESKSQSQGQDSQIMPGSSITPAENVQGFQKCVKEILNLIEEDENSSKLTTLVTNLPILDSSDSSSPQVTQMFTPDQKSAHKFMTPIGFDVLLSSSGGGSYASRRDGSDSSFSLSSDSESESSMSINKHLISPLNDDSSKVKETKVQETDVLLRKNSVLVLEEEICSLITKIQTLSDENTKLKPDVNESESELNSQNALFEAEKSKVVDLEDQVADLLLVVSDSNLKIKSMEQELKTANDEISEVKSQLSSKGTELESIQEDMVSLDKILELQEEVNVFVADISVCKDQITELNTKINQSISEVSLLKTTHSVKEETWSNDIKMSKTEVGEKCKLINELNHKHDLAMTERDGQFDYRNGDAIGFVTIRAHEGSFVI